jgi:hypothetical protein
MEKIHEPNDLFDFSKINLLSPSSAPGGNYFIKFRINDSPLYIQPPKCVTKSATIRSGKKHYCDLMFTNENEHFIRWMENLENYCQKKIFENRNRWFETELDEHDIENSFTSPLKIFKSGKYYITRTSVPTILGKCSLKIYNEDENEIDIETIKENTNVVTILEVQGIKCSSKNFQIDIEIKQMMVFKQNNLFERCVFTTSSSGNKSVSEFDDAPAATATHLSSLEPELPTTEINPDVENPGENVSETNNISLEIVEKELENFETEVATESGTVAETKEVGESADETPPMDVTTSENTAKSERLVPETGDILEVDVDLNDLADIDTVFIKKRNDIYYQMYKEAKRKAKMARDLAISSYLEAKHIKNTYMIENEDTDSDFDEESFENME